jgi:hypothetical protein
MSPKLVHCFGLKGLTAIHHNDQFDENTQDPTIIEFVSVRDLILVTYDLRIWREHRGALMSFSPKIIFLPKSIQDKPIGFQSEWFSQDWPKIATRYADLQQPAIIRVLADCSITILSTTD